VESFAFVVTTHQTAIRTTATPKHCERLRSTETFFWPGANRSSDSINFPQLACPSTVGGMLMEWISWDWLVPVLALIAQVVPQLLQALPGVRYLPSYDQLQLPPSAAVG
jgi:hypothetical protein